MKDPNKSIKEAVKDAGRTLAEYLQPGGRDCEATVKELLMTLDNDEVANAAFWLGLMSELGATIEDLPARMDFDHARANLYAAARDGLSECPQSIALLFAPKLRHERCLFFVCRSRLSAR